MINQALTSCGRSWLFACLLTLGLVYPTPTPAYAYEPEDRLIDRDQVIDADSDTNSPNDVQVLPLDPRELLAAEGEEQLLPQVELSSFIRRLIADPITSDAERRELRILHGQWQDLDLASLSPTERAQIALIQNDFTHEVFNNPNVDSALRAQAALHQGQPRQAITILEAAESTNLQRTYLHGQALHQLGQIDAAIQTLTPLRDQLQTQAITDPAELTAAAEAIVLLARLEGRPSQDYQLAIGLLARAYQDLDPTYWPALFAEARILLDKHNRSEAYEAIMQGLSLNPAAVEGWAMLGRMSVEGYNFAAVTAITDHIRTIHQNSLTADLIDIRSLHQQRDIDSAEQIVQQLIQAHPTHPQILTLLAANQALHYDFDATEQTLSRIDELTPNLPNARFEVAKALGTQRQYLDAERLYLEAIEREPNWTTPRLELGQMYMQMGRDDDAFTQLKLATQLDPFNVGANNQLKLVEEMLGYDRLIQGNLEVVFKPGRDEVLARDILRIIPPYFEAVEKRMGHIPPNRTRIDLMPDAKWFAVRVTGMPELWTIAVCMGDVMALQPPAFGRHQYGSFYWTNVLVHEYVHVVNLSQTENRIPHWFTEALAVTSELTGRSQNTAERLADALSRDALFDLNNINWGFIRPEKPGDRALAYAQAAWFSDFLEARFATPQKNPLHELLELYRQGKDNVEAMTQVTGLTHDEFMTEFRFWANEQVREWGIPAKGLTQQDQANGDNETNGQPTEEELKLANKLDFDPNTQFILNRDILKILLDVDKLIQQQPIPFRKLQTILNEYREFRPLDPWPDRLMIRLASEHNEPEYLIDALHQLDRIEQTTAAYAHQLSTLLRSTDLEAARVASERAIYREPYNATYRELAATLNLQARRFDNTIHHLNALAILESDIAQHQIRLAAIHQLQGNTEQSDFHARQALTLDPNAPVDRFLRNP